MRYCTAADKNLPWNDVIRASSALRSTTSISAQMSLLSAQSTLLYARASSLKWADSEIPQRFLHPLSLLERSNFRGLPENGTCLAQSLFHVLTSTARTMGGPAMNKAKLRVSGTAIRRPIILRVSADAIAVGVDKTRRRNCWS